MAWVLVEHKAWAPLAPGGPEYLTQSSRLVIPYLPPSAPRQPEETPSIPTVSHIWNRTSFWASCRDREGRSSTSVVITALTYKGGPHAGKTTPSWKRTRYQGHNWDDFKVAIKNEPQLKTTIVLWSDDQLEGCRDGSVGKGLPCKQESLSLIPGTT